MNDFRRVCPNDGRNPGKEALAYRRASTRCWRQEHAWRIDLKRKVACKDGDAGVRTLCVRGRPAKTIRVRALTLRTWLRRYEKRPTSMMRMAILVTGGRREWRLGWRIGQARTQRSNKRLDVSFRYLVYGHSRHGCCSTQGMLAVSGLRGAVCKTRADWGAKQCRVPDILRSRALTACEAPFMFRVRQHNYTHSQRHRDDGDSQETWMSSPRRGERFTKSNKICCARRRR